jgi:hypothetical protein
MYKLASNGEMGALRNPATRVLGRRRSSLSPSAVILFQRRLEPHLDQMQHVPIRYSARDRFEEFRMWDRAEVVGKVCFDAVGQPTAPPCGHSSLVVAIQLRWHVDFDYRF